MTDGLLLVDKPSGCTSHDVVMKARRILRQKKIGHCGTLDPAATGLLLLTVGKATRLTRFLIRAPKVYTGDIRLGVVTDTYDLAGEIVEENPVEGIDVQQIDDAMSPYVGTLMQTPPPYCAKKVGGVKYYELARRGEEVPSDQKEITVYEFRRDGDWQPGADVPFRLGCSSGTYARSLAFDVGKDLGCGGLLSSLRRVQIGAFQLGEAADLETLAERLGDAPEVDSEDGKRRRPDPTYAGSAWIPFDQIQLPFEELIADAQQERRLQNGQSVLVRDLMVQEGDWLKVVNQRQRFIAVGFVGERIGSGKVGVVQPKVVFN